MSDRNSGAAMFGRAAGTKLAEAMGLPLEGCIAVTVGIPPDEFATVSVTYALTADHVRLLADLMGSE